MIGVNIQTAQAGTAAFAGLGGAISSLFGGIHMLRAAKAAERSFRRQADVERANASIAAELAIVNGLRAQTNAARERDAGKLLVADVAREGRRALSTIRATAASSGVTEEFSVVDVLAAQAFENSRAVSSTAAEFARREEAHMFQSEDFRRSASTARIVGAERAHALIREGRLQQATLRTRSHMLFARGLFGFGNVLTSGSSAFSALERDI